MSFSKKDRTKIIAATVSGSILEWFDFTLFGILSKLVADKFFPAEDPKVSLLATFGAFAAGFLARPLGAVFLGHLGDRIGRKQTFLITLTLMIIPTTLIGVLPTYAHIGIASPIILVVLRVIQGFALSAEHGGSITYLAEYSDDKRRGLSTAMPMAAATTGMLLASICGFLLATFFTEQQIDTWAWRIPFLLSILFGFIAYYLRRNMEETDAFKQIVKKKKVKRIPVKHLFQSHKKVLFFSTFTFLISAAYPYLLFFYLPNATEKFIHEDISAHVLMLNSVTLIVSIIFFLLSGHWSDKINRRKIMLFFAAVCAVITIPLFYIFPLTNIWNMFAFQIIGTIAFSCFTGPWAAAAAENFSGSIRFTGIALSLNFSAGIFGGTAPMILTSLSFLDNGVFYSGLYFTVLALISLITVFYSPYRRKLVNE